MLVALYSLCGKGKLVADFFELIYSSRVLEGYRQKQSAKLAWTKTEKKKQGRESFAGEDRERGLAVRNRGLGPRFCRSAC